MIILRKPNGVGRVVRHSISDWLSREHYGKKKKKSIKNVSATLLNNCQQ